MDRTKVVNLNELSKDELINIIANQHFSNSVYNKISITDFEVISNSESLPNVEKCLNRLIKKHKTFAELRKNKLTYGENLGVG